MVYNTPDRNNSLSQCNKLEYFHREPIPIFWGWLFFQSSQSEDLQ